jgi:hypothetical protein
MHFPVLDHLCVGPNVKGVHVGRDCCLTAFDDGGLDPFKLEAGLGEMMAEQRETAGLAKGGQPYQSTGVSNTPVEPTFASQGIDKNLAKRAMISKRVHADWWDMQAEVGLFLMGMGTSLILVALIGLIWSMVPR